MARTADTAYTEHVHAIRDLIGAVEEALRAHAREQEADPANWGFVGDLANVRERLAEVHAFLGGAR